MGCDGALHFRGTAVISCTPTVLNSTTLSANGLYWSRPRLPNLRYENSVLKYRNRGDQITLFKRLREVLAAAHHFFGDFLLFLCWCFLFDGPSHETFMIWYCTGYHNRVSYYDTHLAGRVSCVSCATDLSYLVRSRTMLICLRPKKLTRKFNFFLLYFIIEWGMGCTLRIIIYYQNTAVYAWYKYHNTVYENGKRPSKD